MVLLPAFCACQRYGLSASHAWPALRPAITTFVSQRQLTRYAQDCHWLIGSAQLTSSARLKTYRFLRRFSCMSRVTWLSERPPARSIVLSLREKASAPCPVLPMFPVPDIVSAVAAFCAASTPTTIVDDTVPAKSTFALTSASARTIDLPSLICSPPNLQSKPYGHRPHFPARLSCQALYTGQ